MEQPEEDNLDTEFEKNLDLLRQCIAHDVEEVDVVELLNQWINKLSQCQEDEKELRNSYFTAICNQISEGYLQDDFLNGPPPDKLPPLPPLSYLSEEQNGPPPDKLPPLPPLSYLSEEQKNNDSGETTDFTSNENDFNQNEFNKNDEIIMIGQRNDTFDTRKSVTRSAHSEHTFDTKYPFSNQEFLIYNCQSISKFPFQDRNYQQRVNHVIVKLKELKQENLLLHNEIFKLKASIANNDDGVYPSLEAILQRNIDKANKSTQECIDIVNPNDSNLKEIDELKEKNIQLLFTVDNLKKSLQEVTAEKNNELNYIKEQYKIHVNTLKTEIQQQLKQAYESDIEKLSKKMKTHYENELKEMQDKVSNDYRDLIFIKDNMLNTKGQLIEEKDKEITSLRTQINELQNKLTTIQATTYDDHKKELEFYKTKAEQLEKTVAKIEKLKQKTIKSYETKLSFMQKDRHITECSLQLQLVKQRSQVIGDLTEANQHEVTNSMNKLEGKYKDIVANMQATAIQRRLQDQMALETMLHAACGRSQTSSRTNSKFVRKTVRMENRNANYDIGNANLRFDKANNNSFDSDNGPGQGFCLRSEDLCEMFNRVFIPQKDTCDNVPHNK